ncbi:MAG: dihydroxy-acid dehydratase [Alicyclobacillaceae bacterium]|nr:dihydroxy-acid dehydratase [Alicyclobacillaceae bacterium]
MSTKLRSNFESKTGMFWATRRAHWRALGISDEDMEKPKIAVVNSSSELAVCFSHLDEIARKMKEAIRQAGGLPFEIRTAAPSDFITSRGHRGGYILPSRDLIVNDIEVAVEGAMLDGMVCLASCDKTVPGQLMAAARLNIPTIIVACGYQPSGRYKGEHMDIEDVWLNSARLQSGQVTIEELTEMSECAIQGPGVCPGMGTANSMHIASEVLGMSLPGTTPVLANSPKMWDAVRAAGHRIVQLVQEDLKPRDILTPESFRNAVMVMLSICASINTVKHLQAIAREAECDVDVYRLYEEYADQVPLLAAVRPNGDYFIEDFEAAGGARAVMKQLESMLYTDVRTVSGKTVAENLADAVVADEQVIRPTSNPFSRRPSIVLIRGSLAPQTGIVKLGVADDRKLQFRGRAIVYETRDRAIEGVFKGEIQPGHVVVVRGLGPKGTPGMGTVSGLIFELDGAGLSDKVAVVTDGQLSGLVNRGIVVGEVCPEAADGGPLALVEDGDVISIDVERRVMDLEVDEDVLNERRARLRNLVDDRERGWLSIYQRLVRPLPQGGTLV